MSSPTVPTPAPDPYDDDRVVTLDLRAGSYREVLDAAAYFADEFDDRELATLITALRAQLEAAR